MKKLAITCVMAAGLLMAGAGTSSAGEVTGNGKTTQAPQHAQSICAFSGQDTPDSIEGPGPDGNGDDWLGHGVQNYGQFVSHGLKAGLGDERPGLACRGNAVFGE